MLHCHSHQFSYVFFECCLHSGVTSETFGSVVMDFHSLNEEGYYELSRQLTALKIALDALFDR